MIPENFSATGTALANHLWQSTLFAFVAAGFTLALRKNQASLRHHLWLAASLKFLVPFSLLVTLGGHLATLRGSTSAQPVFYFVLQTMSQPFHESMDARSLLRWLPAMAALLWLAGFVTVVSVWWIRWRRVAGAIRNAAPVSDGCMLEILRRVEKSAGVRSPISLQSSQSSLEPGVFGIRRPLLLWPEGLSQHLQDAHVEAVFAHEVQHVRRRDNLAAAMHMVVEAIFWFHPLVWWLGARLVEERELACDEAVLRLGNQPGIYAESILKTCEFCVTSPLACVPGVTGADLKQRIVRIMSQRSAVKLGFLKKMALVAIGTGAVAVPMVAGLIKAPAATAESTASKRAADPQVYHVGGDVTAPLLVYAPDPQYTEKARRAKYEGVCVISTVVDAQGNPTQVQVVRQLGMGLDAKAVEAVKQYKFKPAMRLGQPVAVTVNIEVNFRVR